MIIIEIAFVILVLTVIRMIISWVITMVDIYKIRREIKRMIRNPKFKS